MKDLNDIDRAIVDVLQVEGRSTFAQIAQNVGLSPAAVHERVKKLEARGVITGYRASVDPEKLGAGVTAFILVTQIAGPRGSLEEAFESMPWVEECHHIAGEESLMLKVRAESTRALEHLIWDIRALESVERTKTVVVLATEFEGRPGRPHGDRGRAAARAEHVTLLGRLARARRRHVSVETWQRFPGSAPPRPHHPPPAPAPPGALRPRSSGSTLAALRSLAADASHSEAAARDLGVEVERVWERLAQADADLLRYHVRAAGVRHDPHARDAFVDAPAGGCGRRRRSASCGCRRAPAISTASCTTATRACAWPPPARSAGSPLPRPLGS